MKNKTITFKPITELGQTQVNLRSPSLVGLTKLDQGGYPDLNRELTVPHTVVLPIELHPP